MNLTGLQKTYMRKLEPIKKASFLFNLLALEAKDPAEKELLKKIVTVCIAAEDLTDPLLQVGKNLSLMLATEDLTLDLKSSLLSAIGVLEKLREEDIASKN
jgi:hypothetical protein